MYVLEKFAVDSLSGGGSKVNPLNTLLIVVLVVAFQILFVWFAKVLWNTYLVKVIPAIKPVKDVWHMLAVFVLIKLLF